MCQCCPPEAHVSELPRLHSQMITQSLDNIACLQIDEKNQDIISLLQVAKIALEAVKRITIKTQAATPSIEGLGAGQEVKS